MSRAKLQVFSSETGSVNGRSGLTRLFTYGCGLLGLLAVGLLGCQAKKDGQATLVGGAAVAPTRPAVPPAWQAEGFAGQLTSVRVEPGRVLLDLTLPGKASMPTSAVGFTLCLPETNSYNLKIRRYAVGGQVVQALDDQDRQTTGTAQKALDARQVLAVDRKGIVRHWTIAQLKIQNSFWRPAMALRGSGAQDLTATLEVSWPAEALKGTLKGTAGKLEQNNALARVLGHLVANPEGLAQWAQAQPPSKRDISTLLTDPRPLAPKATAWARLTIEKDGLYRLTARDLAAAGVAVSAGDLGKVRLFAHGAPVPLYRTAAGPGGGGAIYFYGWKSRTPYTHGQVYWLALDESVKDAPLAPAESALLAGTPTALTQLHRSVRLDRDNELQIEHGNFLSIEGLTWVDALLSAKEPLTLPLKLDHPAPLDGQPKLEATFKFYYVGSPDGWTGTTVQVRQAGQNLAELSFKKGDPAEKKLSLPAAAFADGAATLTLAVDKATSTTLDEESGEGIWLDSVQVGYQGLPALSEEGRLVLDKQSVPAEGLYRLELPQAPPQGLLALAVQPVRKTVSRLALDGHALTFAVRNGWQAELYDLAAAQAPAIAPARLGSAALDGDADYLIIMHASLKGALQPLLDLNAKRGLKTKVVDVQDLYDLFSEGMLSPEAIRSYLAYIVHHWSAGSPQYVLLVGDCSSDYLDETRSGVKNLVPTYTWLFGKDKWASDFWFTSVCGEDDLSDFILGRISVNNVKDLEAVLAKTVHYASTPDFGPWRARLGYVADNLEQFESSAEEMRTQHTPESFEARRIYLNHMPLEDNWYIPKDKIERVWAEEKSWMKVSGAATSDIREAFNQGVAELDYFGHGSPNIWTDERIWFGGGSPNSDNQSLASNGRDAFVVNYTCNSGAIDYPMPRWNVCITEDLLMTPKGGAIGLFVPSGPGTTPLHEMMARSWRAALFEDNLRGTGELATMTRLRHALAGGAKEMLYMYILLGDPALQLRLTQRWQDLAVEPAAARPGITEVQARLEGVEPADGQAQAWLEDEQGKVLWQGAAFSYQGGRIQAPVTLPAGMGAPASLRVRLYGWNAGQGSDFVAAGTLNILEPQAQVRSARASRLDGQKVKIEIQLENMDSLEIPEAKLRILRADAPGSGSLAEQTVRLGANQVQKVELVATVPSEAKPICFSAELTQGAAAAQSPWRFALLPGTDWVGFVPELSERRAAVGPGGDKKVVVCVMRGSKPTTATTYMLARRSAAGDVLSTQTVTLAPAALPSQYVAQVTLAARKRSGAPSGDEADRDVLELLETQRNSPPLTRTVSRLPLGELAPLEPRLRIKPGSLKHSPAKPTDGETVYISFEVENIGTVPAGNLSPVLLDKSPQEKGQKLPVQTGLTPDRVPELAPGRSCPITLRWDPIRNSGVQTVWIDLDQNKTRDAQALQDQVSSYRLYIRSKSKLVRVKPPWASRSDEDKAAGRYKLHAEISNLGETDAHAVEVMFFRNERKEEADALGTVLLDVVPAKGKAEAVLTCKINPQDRPTVEMRLKGAAQRLSEKD